MVKQEESRAKIDAEMMSKGSDVEVCVCVSLSPEFLWVYGCVCLWVCGDDE